MKVIITSVSNPRYATADKSLIDCDVVIEGRSGTFPFTARADDTEEHTRAVYNDLVAGKHGPIADYAAPKGTIKKAAP
jgi:hypothetical protein